MPLYPISIHANSDWFTVEITNAAVFTKGAGQTISFLASTLGPGFLVDSINLSVQDKAVRLNKTQFSTSPVALVIQVDTNESALDIIIGHGDNGSVRVESPVDTVTNNQVTGDGQNRLPFHLVLTH